VVGVHFSTQSSFIYILRHIRSRCFKLISTRFKIKPGTQNSLPIFSCLRLYLLSPPLNFCSSTHKKISGKSQYSNEMLIKKIVTSLCLFWSKGNTGSLSCIKTQIKTSFYLSTSFGGKKNSTSRNFFNKENIISDSNISVCLLPLLIS
jgi:hypothetical protein